MALSTPIKIIVACLAVAALVGTFASGGSETRAGLKGSVRKLQFSFSPPKVKNPVQFGNPLKINGKIVKPATNALTPFIAVSPTARTGTAFAPPAATSGSTFKVSATPFVKPATVSPTTFMKRDDAAATALTNAITAQSARGIVPGDGTFLSSALESKSTESSGQVFNFSP